MADSVEVDSIAPSEAEVVEYLENLLEILDPVERNMGDTFDIPTPYSKLAESFAVRRTKFYGGTLFNALHEAMERRFSEINPGTKFPGTEGSKDERMKSTRNGRDNSEMLSNMGIQISKLEEEQEKLYLTYNLNPGGRGIYYKVPSASMKRTLFWASNSPYDEEFKSSPRLLNPLSFTRKVIPAFSECFSLEELRIDGKRLAEFEDITVKLYHEVFCRDNSTGIKLLKQFFLIIQRDLTSTLDQDGSIIPLRLNKQRALQARGEPLTLHETPVQNILVNVQATPRVNNPQSANTSSSGNTTNISSNITDRNVSRTVTLAVTNLIGTYY